MTPESDRRRPVGGGVEVEPNPTRVARARAAGRSAWIAAAVGGVLPPRRPTAATTEAARATWEHFAALGLADDVVTATLRRIVEGVPDDLRRAA